MDRTVSIRSKATLILALLVLALASALHHRMSPSCRVSSGASIFRPVGSPEEGLPYTNGLGMTFQWIQPGGFTMGLSSPTDPNAEAAAVRPRIAVKVISGFWIGKNKCPREALEALLPRSRNSSWTGEFLPEAGLAPMIRWSDAMEFCRLLTRREHENGLPTSYLYTLPTEAQWEYACTAGLTSPPAPRQFHFDKVPKNLFGLDSASDHWWEYCLDRWHSSFESPPGDERAWLSSAPEKENLRVIRVGYLIDPPSPSHGLVSYYSYRNREPQASWPHCRVWVRPVLVHKDVYARLVDESLLGWSPAPQEKPPTSNSLTGGK